MGKAKAFDYRVVKEQRERDIRDARESISYVLAAAGSEKDLYGQLGTIATTAAGVIEKIEGLKKHDEQSFEASNFIKQALDLTEAVMNSGPLVPAFLFRAAYIVGYAEAIIDSKSRVAKTALTNFSTSGSDALHKENRESKAQVFDWLDANFSTCKSMDAAAAKMAEELVPYTFRTVRDWVGEWKKLRSAGTP